MVEDEPQYNVVLKMVLWGDDREAIFRRLKVNGIEGERAAAIYEKAMGERLRLLRGEGLKYLVMGLAFLSLGALIYFFFELDQLSVEEFGEGVHGMPLLPTLLGFISVLLAFLGMWKMVRGLFEIVFAGSKKGSIGD